jgi:uncharacterized protein YndB with AHSA1/START domain
MNKIEKNKIENRIELKAPMSKVWQALSNYKQFGTWFRVIIDGPFEPGKTATGHMTYPGYEHLRWEVEIKEMVHEKLFSFTWHPYAIDPQIDYSKEEPTLVEFRLQKIEEGTLLILTESGFDKIPQHRLSEALRMNEKGWTEQMKNIASYVQQR